MANKTESPAQKLEIPTVAPFGVTMISGQKGVGKTLACLNSPWQPVHIIDTELSSADYFKHQKRLIGMKIIRGEFTRAECLDWESTKAEIYRITGNPNIKGDMEKAKGNHYGTIVIDTGGQWSEWVANDEHVKSANNEKLGQIVWGTIRSRLRNALISLSSHCDCLLLTAHERKYNGVISPRANPALLEIAAISIRLTRDANQRLPSAQFVASRVPFFPPRIENFTIAKMLPFFNDPADWENLQESEKIPSEPQFENPEEEAE